MRGEKEEREREREREREDQQSVYTNKSILYIYMTLLDTLSFHACLVEFEKLAASRCFSLLLSRFLEKLLFDKLSP